MSHDGRSVGDQSSRGVDCEEQEDVLSQGEENANGDYAGQSTSWLRLLERPRWGESKFKWQSARWVAPGTSFSSHLEIT